MKRKGVFVVLAAVGMICLACAVSRKKGAEHPISVIVSAGKGEMAFDFGKNTKMKLVLIPAGQFMMGSPNEEEGSADAEDPQHEVTISKPFYMGIYDVTRGQFAAFVNDSGYETDAQENGWSMAWDGSKFGKVHGASWKRPGFDQTDEHPVVCVSHNDAVAFCQWLSKKTGKAVELPTEAQWEYACRAGTTTAYQWGDDPGDGKGWCNAFDWTAKKVIGGNGEYFNWDDGYAFTSPVGKFKPNTFGLYDMHGNVRQWCADWYDPNYYSTTESRHDPRGPNDGNKRVLRGGSWGCGPTLCGSACRFFIGPEYHGGGSGFRVVVLPGSN